MNTWEMWGWARPLLFLRSGLPSQWPRQSPKKTPSAISSLQSSSAPVVCSSWWGWQQWHQRCIPENQGKLQPPGGARWPGRKRRGSSPEDENMMTHDQEQSWTSLIVKTAMTSRLILRRWQMHNGDTLTIPATTMIRTINNQSGRPILSKNSNQRAVSLFTGQNVILDIL